MKALETKDRFKRILIRVIVTLMVISVAFIKYEGDEINYRNSDATWHTLLTMKAYDETSWSEHKFLPIVSLGEEDDKWIPWGSTIPDEKGNYYYTSFTTAGFILPYFFVKILNLPYTEFSLYCFNAFLLILSCMVIISLMEEISERKNNYFITAITLCYIASAEIMHGMGIVYWCQSVMQVTLPLQCLMYYRYIKRGNNADKVVFFVLCAINPYIEWTGFVANGGFFIAELARNYREKGIKKFQNAFLIGLFTVFALMVYVLQFLTITDVNTFLGVVRNRVSDRGIKADGTYIDLFKGYFESFGGMIMLTAAFILIRIFTDSKKAYLAKEDKYLLFTAVFPLIENIIMKQHAIEYSYDRMKLALPLIIIIYCLICVTTNKIKKAIIGFVIVAVSLTMINLYRNNSSYVWNIDYRDNNTILCEYINENYNEQISGYAWAVRGYLNMTLGHGCYEWVKNIDQLKELAKDKNKDYVVYYKPIYVDGVNWPNMEKLYAIVYNMHNGSECTVTVENDQIVIS